MTAERYAAATDLVERYAAAFASAVPDQPEDVGFYGPRSVTWRLAADLSAPVAGLRSVLMQALHPLAMAGVDQHSAGAPTRWAGWPPPRRTRPRSLTATGPAPAGPPGGSGWFTSTSAGSIP